MQARQDVVGWLSAVRKTLFGSHFLGMETDSRQDRLGTITRTIVQTHKEAGFPQEEAAEAKLPAATAAMGLLRGVAYELNEALALGLAVPQQCMCACYEGNGARYVAHRDNVCVDAQGEIDCHNSREVTVIHPFHNVDIKNATYFTQTSC